MADQTVQYQTGFAPSVDPYAQTLLGAASDYTFGTPAYTDSAGNKFNATQGTPYTSYSDWARANGLSGDQIAQFSGLQNQAFQGASDLYNSETGGIDPRSLSAASGLQGLAQLAGKTGFTGKSNYGNQFDNTGNFNYAAQNTGAASAGAAPSMQAAQGNWNPGALNQYQMGPAQQVGSQNFGQPQASQYMSPYMQSVVENQQRDAERQADIATTQRNAAATGAGAFGGSRHAIMDAEAARNLAQQKGDIQAAGLQSAYTNAQQQFNTDQARGLQAQQSNQGANLQTGVQNLNALLSTQALGSGYNQQMNMANLANQQQTNQANQAMQGQYGLANLANQQQANLANQAAQNQAGQFNAGQNFNAANAGAQYGQAANALNAQQQQFGANLGLQGLQAGMAGYGSLGSLGQNMYGQTVGNINLMDQLGTQQQQQAQNMINTNQQNYANQMNYPYKQMGFMSDIIRGLPVSTTGSTMYQAAPSTVSQLAGAGLTAAGLFGAGKKAGGAIKSKKPSGLSALMISKIA